jgi:Ran GTPase-activating protein (RanGAP) involved in mRNA processing and transport
MSQLSDPERERLRAAFTTCPLKQNKIRHSITARVKVSGAQSGSFSNATVILTEHAVFIAKTSSKSAEIIRWMHFLDMRAVLTDKNDRFRIRGDKMKMVIVSKEQESFIRALKKGHELSVSRGWHGCDFAIGNICNSPEKLHPVLKFQLAFAAYSSFCGLEPRQCPDLAAYFFAQCAYRNFCFDFEDILYQGKNALYPFVSWHPVVAAYRDTRHAVSFSISRYRCPELIAEASILIAGAPNLRVLSLVGVDATSGCEQLAYTMQASPSALHFIDLSGNRLTDVSKLAKAIEATPIAVAGLVLNDMALDDATVTQLFRAVSKSEGIRELSVLGSKISAKNCNVLAAWLHQHPEVRVLALGPVADASSIVRALAEVKLHTLRLIDSNLEDAATPLCDFLGIAGSVRMVDFSGSTFRDRLLRVMEAISSCPRERPLSLILRGMFPRGKGSKAMFPALDLVRGALKELVLDGNSMGTEELMRLGFVFNDSEALTSISLSGIFHAKQLNVGVSLADFVQKVKVRKLVVSGEGTLGLQAEIVPLIRALSERGDVKVVDVRHNKIGDHGLAAICEMIRATEIERIYVEDMELSGAQPLWEFMEACAASGTLIDAPFPAADYLALLHVKSRKGRKVDDGIERDFAALRGRVNLRIQVNRCQREKKIETPLQFRRDPVLSDVIAAAIKDVAAEYDRWPINGGDPAVANDRDKTWAQLKWAGLKAPTPRLRECERIREPARPAIGETPILPQIGFESPFAHPAPPRFAQPPKEAYPPVMPPATLFMRPEIGFLDIWPQSDDGELDDEDLPPSKCPVPFVA